MRALRPCRCGCGLAALLCPVIVAAAQPAPPPPPGCAGALAGCHCAAALAHYCGAGCASCVAGGGDRGNLAAYGCSTSNISDYCAAATHPPPPPGPPGGWCPNGGVWLNSASPQYGADPGGFGGAYPAERVKFSYALPRPPGPGPFGSYGASQTNYFLDCGGNYHTPHCELAAGVHHYCVAVPERSPAYSGHCAAPWGTIAWTAYCGEGTGGKQATLNVTPPLNSGLAPVFHTEALKVEVDMGLPVWGKPHQTQPLKFNDSRPVVAGHPYIFALTVTEPCLYRAPCTEDCGLYYLGVGIRSEWDTNKSMEADCSPPAFKTSVLTKEVNPDNSGGFCCTRPIMQDTDKPDSRCAAGTNEPMCHL